ncbi:MAG: shikimate dehydrogenase [Campylobacteraceae bacterium]|jgi:shikimate dehydrogenase|nr:shikimate dehydrogenase [Campylobacteraceae bacterium]
MSKATLVKTRLSIKSNNAGSVKTDLSTTMKEFCVIGNPIEHSISPNMHNAAYKAFGIKAVYEKMLLSDEKLLRESFFEANLDGANITVPYKETAFNICDEIKGIATQIEAVNTIVKRDNKLIGFNTDAAGFFKAIKEFGKIRNALILGAGGAAKAIAFILKQNGIEPTILNRSIERLVFFEQKGFASISWDGFVPKKYDIVINTTSAGLKDDTLPAPVNILNQALRNARFGFDVIYNKKTPFLKLCAEFGLKYKDGLDMLLYQAVFAFNIFFDKTYDETKIAQAMKKSLFNQ